VVTVAAVIDPEIPDLLGVTEIAAMRDISRQAVLKMIESGRLPARRVHTTWVVRRAVVEALPPTESGPPAP
jgi:hypothetical protein